MKTLPLLLSTAVMAIAQGNAPRPTARHSAHAGVAVPATDRSDLEDRPASAAPGGHPKAGQEPHSSPTSSSTPAGRPLRPSNTTNSSTPNELPKARKLPRRRPASAPSQLAQGQSPWTTRDWPGGPRLHLQDPDKSVRSPTASSCPPTPTPPPPLTGGASTTWFHGRGETLSEVSFLADRERATSANSPRAIPSCSTSTGASATPTPNSLARSISSRRWTPSSGPTPSMRTAS